MEASKRRLAGDTARAANTCKVRQLRYEANVSKGLLQNRSRNFVFHRGVYNSSGVAAARPGSKLTVCFDPPTFRHRPPVTK